jgi:hypothetical protein
MTHIIIIQRNIFFLSVIVLVDQGRFNDGYVENKILFSTFKFFVLIVMFRESTINRYKPPEWPRTASESFQV